jgi:hypothetical protein
VWFQNVTCHSRVWVNRARMWAEVSLYVHTCHPPSRDRVRACSAGQVSLYHHLFSKWKFKESKKTKIFNLVFQIIAKAYCIFVKV